MITMQVGKRYIVTRRSLAGEFAPGDHVWPCADGGLMCHEAGGWMAAEDVPSATEGMAVVLDAQWAAKRLERLSAGLT